MKLILISLLSVGLLQCEPAPTPTPITEPSPVAEIVAGCVEKVPPLYVEDCPSWEPLYACLGATVTEVATLTWIRARESACGLLMFNKRTSDTGDCHLNGVHGKPGYFAGRRWDQGWAVDLLGLTPYTSKAAWRSNLDTSEGVAKMAAACLVLLRQTFDDSPEPNLGVPDSFGGCSHWSVHRAIKRGFGCGVVAA